MPAIDQDDSATWIQLRDRLRELREWAETKPRETPLEALAIINRPREVT
jgi:hypothetical protein